LRKYLESLTRHQQQMIKGITSKKVWDYLQMQEADFKNLLQDSLTLNELKKLAPEEKKFRDKLIDEIMAVWRRHVGDAKEYRKENKLDEQYIIQKSVEGWMPKHHDKEQLERGEYKQRKLSVSQAARLHEAKDVTARGILSGVQPLRKMYKGVSVKCLKCGEVWSKPYDKPELFPSLLRVHQIRMCPACKVGKWLEFPTFDRINAVVAELKDENTFSEIDPIKIIVFGDEEPAFDNTLNIERHLGEPVEVSGDIYTVNTGKSMNDPKAVAYLYVKYLMDYVIKRDIQLSNEDVKAIKRFVDRIGDKIVDKLSEMFAVDTIKNNYVKKGLLLVAASTSMDKTVKKINTILVGGPGLAKTQLLKSTIELVPGSRYESAQFTTGKSLTAVVDREEDNSVILRSGPIPTAKGAIAALNEIGQLSEDDQGYLLDTMQEQAFTTVKYGREFHIDAPTAIIASANPVGWSWKSELDEEERKIDIDKIPTIKPLLDRFDLIFAFKDDRKEESLLQYAYQKSDMEDKLVPNYNTYLAKHIMYVKQRHPKPKFSDEAIDILNHYYAKIRLRYGTPRIRDTIYKIARNLAMLKLKNIVDETDARETVTFYNVILQQLDMVIATPSSPKDTAYEECLKVLMNSAFPIAFEEVIKTVCEVNPHVHVYIGRSFVLGDNKKLRVVLDMLRNHSRVKEVQNKPIVLQYISAGLYDQYDQYDQYDRQTLTPPQNENEKNTEPEAVELQKKIFKSMDGMGETGSYRSYRSYSPPSPSDTSDSPYKHLIETEDMPSTEKTAYKCKEHPNIWDTNLKDLETSHFKPFH
jgi:DNA replicative helicase MCM subunit Mcm2 (Cdc46/Mcm family)